VRVSFILHDYSLSLITSIRMMKLDATKFGLAGAIVAAVCMLLLSVASAFGMYLGAVEMMQQAHLFYSPDVVGTITGMIEAAVLTCIALYAFSALYNALLQE
jgi:hypothetical protein